MKNPLFPGVSEREAASFGPRHLKPIESVDWCWQTLSLLKRFHQCKEISIQDFEKVLAEVVQHRVWERVPPESPYGTLDEMLKVELGVSSAEEATRTKAQMLASDPEVKPSLTHADAMAKASESKPRGEDGAFVKVDDPSGDNVTARPGRGNSTNYLIRRLKRDAENPSCPHQSRAVEALEKLRTGEITSARAAGVHAGIVRAFTPLDALRRAWGRADEAHRKEFLDWLKHNGWLSN